MIRGTIVMAGVLLFCVFARDIVGNVPMLVNLKSMLLVVLGSLIAGLLSIPVNTLAGLRHSILISLKRPCSDSQALIEQIVALARLHRMLDIRDLARRYRSLENPFLRRGLLQLLDHSDRLRIEESLEKEMSLYLSGLNTHLAAVHHFARLAPVLGFVGTIIGLINVLNHMGDATQIGQGMAISLLTTFYGLLTAHFLFTPLAGKLAAHIQRETLLLNIVIEGVLAIHDNCMSTEISHRLRSYVEAEGPAPVTFGLGPMNRWLKYVPFMKPDGLER